MSNGTIAVERYTISAVCIIPELLGSIDVNLHPLRDINIKQMVTNVPGPGYVIIEKLKTGNIFILEEVDAWEFSEMNKENIGGFKYKMTGDATEFPLQFDLLRANAEIELKLRFLKSKPPMFSVTFLEQVTSEI